MPIEDELSDELRELKARERLRTTRPLGGGDRARPTRGGESLLAFCSNDYLGLASHPSLAAAAAAAARDFGFGSGASRLVSGESPLHATLEQDLADLVDQDAALLFPTGYQTNIGVMTALAGPADLIVSDAANHASIIDGCRLSRARIAVFKHADPNDAQRALHTSGSFRRRLLVTESVFSMDGDRAPLTALADLAKRGDAIFIVDEAHALGVAGPQGRGLCFAAGIRPTVTIGTLGKALGAAGGFAAGSMTLRAVLVNLSRTFIYTTSPPHPVVAAAIAALRLIRSIEGDLLRDDVARRAQELRQYFANFGHPVAGSDLILPLRLGSDRQALDASAALEHDGIVVPAIRPPTVPEGTARLRITVSSAHTQADVARLARSLHRILRAP